MVGETVNLSAKGLPPEFPAYFCTWKIGGKAVQTWSADLRRAFSTPLDPIGTHITVHWLEGTPPNGITDVEFGVETPGAGGMAKATFHVDRPRSDFTARPTNMVPPFCLIEGTAYFGGMGTPPLVEGMNWVYKVTTPPHGAGEFALFQVVDTIGVWAPVDPNKKPLMKAGQNCHDCKEANNWYQGSRAPIAGGQTKKWEIGDSPGIELKANYAASLSNKFHTYLMYRPSGTDSIWVTLKKMDWSMSMEVPPNPEEDTAFRGKYTEDPVIVDSTELPTWDKWVGDLKSEPIPK